MFLTIRSRLRSVKRGCFMNCVHVMALCLLTVHMYYESIRRIEEAVFTLIGHL